MNLNNSRRTMVMRGVIACLLLALGVATVISSAANPATASPAVRYVKPTASGSGNCSDWANACTLQNALGAAGTGDEIWVAEGTYKPGALITATFQLTSGVALYGGFAGSESSLEERDWTVHETILSGDIGTPDDTSDNSYHVVTGSGTNDTAVLDGFAIRGGHAAGPSTSQQCGGGMFNEGGSPTLGNVTFSGNSASMDGGGMDNWNSSPTLVNVTFSGNSASLDGGGMENWDNSSPTLVNVTFSGNSAECGGGMINYNSSPTLVNVTFSGNSADSGGGGMYNSDSSPALTNCILWGNTAPAGPQIYNSSSTPTISYSDIQGGYSGTGNIDADPLFVRNPDPGDGDWTTPGDNDYGDLRLQLTSPAIDVGDNTAVPVGITTDLDGNPRISNGVVDMGAYEARLHVYVPLVLKN